MKTRICLSATGVPGNLRTQISHLLTSDFTLGNNSCTQLNQASQEFTKQHSHSHTHTPQTSANYFSSLYDLSYSSTIGVTTFRGLFQITLLLSRHINLQAATLSTDVHFHKPISDLCQGKMSYVLYCSCTL